MMTTLTLYTGDSSDIIPVRPFIENPFEPISGDWVCKIAIVDARNMLVLAAKAVTEKSDDQLHYLVQLLPDDTKDLVVQEDYSVFNLVIQVSNDVLSPPYSKEKRITLIVKQGIIT